MAGHFAALLVAEYAELHTKYVNRVLSIAENGTDFRHFTLYNDLSTAHKMPGVWHVSNFPPNPKLDLRRCQQFLQGHYLDETRVHPFLSLRNALSFTETFTPQQTVNFLLSVIFVQDQKQILRPLCKIVSGHAKHKKDTASH